jgi:hypothetical protein
LKKLLTESTINYNAETYGDAVNYLQYRYKQLRKFGVRMTMERYTCAEQSIITHYKSPVGDWDSLYLLKKATGQGNYERLVKKYKLKIVTLEECGLTEFLEAKNIKHMVLKHSPAYKLVQDYYGDQRAKRSGVPYIYHIDEGLTILNKLGASYNTKEAFCLHPILQMDKDFNENKDMDLSGIETEAIILAMEYRRVANSYLSKSRPSDFVGFSCPEVKEMLIADKVQNYKDFIKYQKDTLANGTLFEYFNYWFDLLEVDYSVLTAAIL